MAAVITGSAGCGDTRGTDHPGSPAAADPATPAAAGAATAPGGATPSAPAEVAGVAKLGSAPGPAATLPPLPGGAVLVGKGTAASCTEEALLAALRTVQRKGRGTVGFDCGTAPVTIRISRKLEIDGNGSSAYTVDGRNTVTLDGQRRTGLFHLPAVEGLAMTFRRLKMVNARGDVQGAAIHGGWRNKLVIEDCRFVNNTSTSAAGRFDGGGAVYVHEGSAVVRRSVFDGNTAANGGGIQNTIGDVLIEDSVFRNNRSNVRGSGGGGGAVYSDSGSLVMRRSEVRRNTAMLQGGGMFLWNAKDKRTVVEDSVIADNRVTDAPNAFGGGIRSGSGPVELRGTRFLRNSSAAQGGGLYNADDALVTVTGCTFTGNTADQGGAIFKVNGTVKLSRTTFRDNRPANVL
jgi:hypothetical protein